jgi:hypothetical protein
VQPPAFNNLSLGFASCTLPPFPCHILSFTGAQAAEVSTAFRPPAKVAKGKFAKFFARPNSVQKVVVAWSKTLSQCSAVQRPFAQQCHRWSFLCRVNQRGAI